MIPYYYKLKFKPTGQYYVGIQYGKSAHPDNLWDKYFTSSKIIKKLIAKYGVSAFEVKVKKIFISKDNAMEYERKILLRTKANINDKMLNESLGFKESYIPTGECSSSRKEAISKSRLNTPKTACEYCGKLVDPGNYKAWHGIKCKHNPCIDPAILQQRKDTAVKRKIEVENKTGKNFSDNLKLELGCIFCKRVLSVANFKKYHGDRCLKNVLITPEDCQYRKDLNEKLALTRQQKKTQVK